VATHQLKQKMREMDICSNSPVYKEHLRKTATKQFVSFKEGRFLWNNLLPLHAFCNAWSKTTESRVRDEKVDIT